ncbi:MAG TPA: hypothetical protein VEC18_11110, partial [Myxococcota bacterium]|nr:hypothetical protein [Myxococcota bacterium]
AVARFWNNDSALCLALTDEAIDIARRSGDASALAEALIAQLNVMSRPAFLHRQLELSDEIARLAYESGNLNLIFLALLFRMEEYIARGDSGGMRHDLPEIRRIAEELRQPPERSFVMMIDATSLLFQGKIAEAARVGREALDLGALGGDPYYQITRTLHRYGVFYEQQKLERLEDEIRHLAETHRPGSMWFCALANLCSLIGKTDEARNLFEALALGSFASVSQDFGWPTSMYHLSDLCVRLGDAKRAALLYEQLLPHAKRNMVFSWMAFYGSVSRCLGLLAATMGNRERASEHFEDAIQSSRALGATLWTARARCDYARFLLAGGEPEQQAKARAMIDRVTLQIAEMDSACLAAEVASLAAS